MELLSIKKNNAELKFTTSELLMLNAALNEVCNGIALAEFETRMGSEKKEVAFLLEKIRAVLDEMTGYPPVSI